MVGDFGDTPADILKWTQQREKEKKEAAGDMTTTLYGEWDSPISSNDITKGSVGLGAPKFDGEDLYWVEGRATEGGRQVIVKKDASGDVTDMTPAAFNVRTRVHEYGGGAWTVKQGVIYFTNFADQRLYAQFAFPGAEPIPLTPPDRGLRFADFAVDSARERLVCVVEEHKEGAKEPQNYLASVKFAGETDGVFPEVQKLAEGADFYSSPRLSSDGTRVAWLQWEHPNMPWDSTLLNVASVGEDGALGEVTQVAGGPAESVTSPLFDALGELYFVSDRSGWYNVYRAGSDGKDATCLLSMEAEFSGPMWGLGHQSFNLLPDGTLLCGISIPGELGGSLNVLDPLTGALTPVLPSYSNFGGMSVCDKGVAIVRGGFDTPMELVTVPLDQLTAEKPAADVVKLSTSFQVKSLYLSKPRPIKFDTPSGYAWMYFYPPKNAKANPPPGTLPPLLVKSHGGPTAGASTQLNLGIQYWTSRGYAVADVDYTGSTGYGRAYRDGLKGTWGVRDVEDCCEAARYLADQGLVDPEMLAIEGGSAGGYTTLACLAFQDRFKAGASFYGIGDLETLAKDTHKFESRYLDSLVGRYPEDKAIYKERSPINFVEQFTCPIIFFQGEEDKVVPLNQAQDMHSAVKNKGVLTSLVVYPGEAHGFRKDVNIRQSLDGRLFFFNTVFGLKAKMPDDLDEIILDNFDPLLKAEPRSFIFVDGYELEIGRESEIVHQVGYSDPGNSAYFPEERPDRPSGGAETVDKPEELSDFVEWL